MDEHVKPRVLIVGAGAMGILAGYVLSLANNVDVTFLVRPHRTEALDRPQILYSYDDDNHLKQFRNYTYITDPSKIINENYDYILLTLDGATLRNEAGQSLTKTIGQAVRGTSTKVILGSVFFGARDWFLQVSDLQSDQVANGYLGPLAYLTKAATFPVHPPTDPATLSKADFAFADCLPYGFCLDSSAADGFAKLWNASRVSHCEIKTPLDLSLFIYPAFAAMAACELMGWANFETVDDENEAWRLGVAAMREIQGLGIYGESGQQAARLTTEDGVLAAMTAFEKKVLPLDFQAFNRYHHGGKVNAQDRDNLRAFLDCGKAEGKPMPALEDLLRRVDERQGAGA